MSENFPLPDSLPTSLQLERGELITRPDSPFFQLSDSELDVLRNPLPMHLGSKDISYDPITKLFSGRRLPSDETTFAFQEIFERFSAASINWLAQEIPEYARGLTPDRVTWRRHEEANRPLRHSARNDLLHIDHFATRPSNGRRILRLYVNFHCSDPQIWATSERFSTILERYRQKNVVPNYTQAEWLALGSRWLRLFRSGWRGRSEYDAMMLRIHHDLKNDSEFQVKAQRKIWTFPSGSLWFAFTDALSYAWLRGQHTLEQSFFVSPDVLQDPDESPLQLLCRNENRALLPLAG